MSDTEPRRSVKPTFSLLNLLALTALVAMGTAIVLAYSKYYHLSQQRSELLALSSRLHVDSDDQLASATMPRVANDFRSWQVNVPDDHQYELRLSMGPISENVTPPIVGRVPISAGQHRVTLFSGDSIAEEFRYTVYVDGTPVIDQKMGSDWIPGGWSSASGLSWRPAADLDPAPIQLYALSYQPKRDFGTGNYFNGQNDNYVTQNGLRLWIGQRDRTLEPASSFVGLQGDSGYVGMGLRDGLRYKIFGNSPYEWTFSRPQLETTEPVVRIFAEFFSEDGTELSSQTKGFQTWQLCNDALGEEPLKWKSDPQKTTYTAFLKAMHSSNLSPRPIVELKWDKNRSDEVGIRLAQSPANQQIKRWRIRILDGTTHLWRELLVNDQLYRADKIKNGSEPDPSDGLTEINLDDNQTKSTHLRWRTDEALPLQVLERHQQQYKGMRLYKGLPITEGIEIPASLNPKLAVTVIDKDPSTRNNAFPGGAVFGELQIDLDATARDWIWIEAKSKN